MQDTFATVQNGSIISDTCNLKYGYHFMLQEHDSIKYKYENNFDIMILLLLLI